METWILYGVIAALLFGTYVVVSKVVTSEKYFGLNIHAAVFLMLIGIAIVFLLYSFSGGVPKLANNPTTLALAILAGVLWAAGMIITYIALNSGADVTRLTPVYNTNTLVAVTLGIILLGELPGSTEKIKVIVGAILIVIGGILVSV
ncbi:MAG: GRP family sugar transporter [Candidatus Micrarchaeota archaeon]|nr:GRP family sugar transporter [Candidatus Micrarchaeota archaeon]